MGSILETRKLTFSYNKDIVALKEVDISIAEGKTTAILGGNGSGKSTLFLNLNGVLKPTSGEVLFKGQSVMSGRSDLTELRRHIGIVFQNPDDQLFSTDVRSDIAFGPLNMGLSKEEVIRRVEEVMDQTGVRAYADQPTHALSFGQKKRVAIAGVLAMKPEVIILDEPTAGLDPSGVTEILGLLMTLKEKNSLTVILSTHEIDLVPLYCDEVYVLDQGCVVMHGTGESIFKFPQILRRHALRLPRIGHLMEILNRKDQLDVDVSAATIGKARQSILRLVGKRDE
jgi:cobalt/nickel transport system ATP-binding protein